MHDEAPHIFDELNGIRREEGIGEIRQKNITQGKDYGAYVATDKNIDRMRRGLAPIGWDGKSVQLHHWKGIANDFYDYSPVSSTVHKALHAKR